jgi:hypothetical protein
MVLSPQSQQVSGVGVASGKQSTLDVSGFKQRSGTGVAVAASVGAAVGIITAGLWADTSVTNWLIRTVIATTIGMSNFLPLNRQRASGSARRLVRG